MARAHDHIRRKAMATSSRNHCSPHNAGFHDAVDSMAGSRRAPLPAMFSEKTDNVVSPFFEVDHERFS
jgi:hypothetical protein